MKLKTFLFALSVIFLFSCKTYKVPQNIEIESYVRNGEPIINENDIPKFQGIRDILDSMEDDQTLNAYVVHGMGTKYLEEFDSMLYLLSLYVGLTLEDSFSICTGADPSNDPNLKFFFYNDNNSNRKIKFTYIHWSPALWEYKNFIDSADNVTNRAKHNKTIKNLVVNDGFGDVTGMLDSTIQKKVFRAFEMAFLFQNIPVARFASLPDVQNAKVNIQYIRKNVRNPTVVISGSFGSKITFEYLSNYISLLNKGLNTLQDKSTFELYLKKGDVLTIENLKDFKGAEFANELEQTDYYWFLLSNQLPLLAGVDFEFFDLQDNKIKVPDNAVSNFPNILKQSRTNLVNRTKMVSFYDPNDLLGYRILAKDVYGNSYAKDLYNISIPVQCKKIIGIANPLTAHSGAKHNAYLLYLMANGWDGKTPLPNKNSSALKNKVECKCCDFSEGI